MGVGSCRFRAPLAAASLAVALLRCGDARPAPAAQAPAALPPARARALDVELGDARLAAQVRHVIESVERTGHPPQGVAQGGRRHGQKGVFDNVEGRLPRRGPGYYRETDVWPRAPGGRGPQRLVFGGEGEVFYTADHYRTFVRVR